MDILKIPKRNAEYERAEVYTDGDDVIIQIPDDLKLVRLDAKDVIKLLEWLHSWLNYHLDNK